MSIPSTPVRRSDDPFSSPARGVCWSPGAATTLLDVFPPNTDLIEGVLDGNISPVRRASRPMRGTHSMSRGPFVSPAKPIQRSSSTQSHHSFISDDMFRFLASPINSSSPPSIRSQISHSPNIPSSPNQQDLSFYGASLDVNELDKYYQLASPASGGSLLSRSTSFYTRSPASQSFQPLSPIHGSPIMQTSSPVFPPPASPPSFATRTHIFSPNDQLSSPLPSPAHNRSRAAVPLPPSSPPPETSSSSPFEYDPFVVHHGSNAARTGTLDILEDTYSADYELPTIQPESGSDKVYTPIERRGKMYSTRNAVRSTVLLGVTKAPRVKSKTVVRPQKGKPVFPASGSTTSTPLAYAEQVSASTSSSTTHLPYLSPVSSTHTPASARPLFASSTLSQDVCATPDIVLPTRSNQALSTRFIFPTPSTTTSLTTPSTATTTSLVTPTSTMTAAGLLCSPEIVDPYSTPANGPIQARPKDVQGKRKRERYTRFFTPSPVPVPSAHVNEVRGREDTLPDAPVDDLPLEVAGQSISSLMDGTMQNLEKVELNSADYLSGIKEISGAASTNTNDRSPHLVLSLRRSKRGREIENNTNGSPLAKKSKGMSNVAKQEDIKVEMDPDPMELLVRPTRFQTRAVAALFKTPSASTTRPTVQKPSLKKGRGRPGLVSTRGKVAGRAPSRVSIQQEGQPAQEIAQVDQTEVVKDDKTDSSEEPEGRETKIDEHSEDESECTDAGPSNSATPDDKRIVPSDLLPRPDTNIVFDSDGNIVQRMFPRRFPIHEKYKRWYRRFPVSSYFMEEDPAKAFVLGDDAPKSAEMQPRTRAGYTLIPNKALHFNLYTPRFVRGVSAEKVGLCAICIEPVWRGGEDKVVLLRTKASRTTETRLANANITSFDQISVLNYHMQYYHGISSQTGLPFSPPVAFRTSLHKAAHAREKSKIEEGKCHSCERWIRIESTKYGDVLVPELHWWKHAASCHGTSRLKGDQDPYIEDSVYQQLREYESKFVTHGGSNSEQDLTTGDLGGSSASAKESLSLDRPEECYGQGSSSPRAHTNEKGLQDSSIILDKFFEGVDSDSDLTDLSDDG
ncbi:hypothetical protein FRC09_007998 [Ceratobasidium sp. 395]|nr:hypothetical protein FRC09_007998 [Ceratobasidium sp. 395]